MTKFYGQWMERGIHIITPSKKSNSGDMTYYSAMRVAQRRINSHFFYDAGAFADLFRLTAYLGAPYVEGS